MRNQIASRGLPVLLLLMGVAVILILAGAGSVGLSFGLVVAGTAGVLGVSMMLFEVANGQDRDHTREVRGYQRPYVKRF